MPQVNILHITAHLGGGVGRALSSIVSFEKRRTPLHVHKLILLEDPEKRQFVEVCIGAGVEVLLKPAPEAIAREMAAADVVVLHWWHHPEMAKLLASFPQVPVRLVLWSHVNGCNYPCLPYKFVALPHRVFFTSPFSLENPAWSEAQRARVRANSSVVYGLGELEFSSRPRKRPGGDFVVGYVGTLSDSKIHPKFAEYCYAVSQKVPAVRFVMVGDVSHGNAILRRARAYRIDARMTFTGYSSQILDELAKFDVFGYPLNPKHFGTTENVLLEAMAFGLPVVALNHNAEKYIVREHKKVGLLADSVHHYAESMKYLYDHPGERERIGDNAREYVRGHFTFEKNVELMRAELQKILALPRRKFCFSEVFGAAPRDWFLASLGEDRPVFEMSLETKPASGRDEIERRIRCASPILREKTKSSVSHFAKSFPGDRELRYWNGLLARKVNEMNAPLVSIGLPSYNRNEGLRKALECFTSQTYRNLEIIVSDNCSSKDPTGMVESLAKKDPRIKYYRQASNIGMKLNGDFLFKKASGKYFILGSDDDWWDSDFVLELVEAMLAEDGAVCAFCDFEEVDEAGRKIVSLSRYARARKLLGLRVHSYPDHYPLLAEFAVKDPVARLKNFILQKEYDGKANVHRALCDRQVFLDSINKLYDLGMAECWAFDQLLAFTLLTRGQLALSDRILFRCTVGNPKHYVDPRSKLEYLKGYSKVVDSCFEGKSARELHAAINERYTDRRVGFFQEYVAALHDFAAKAVAVGESVSAESLARVLDMVKAGDHSGALSAVISYDTIHSPTSQVKRAGEIRKVFVGGGGKEIRSLAKGLIRTIREI